MQKRKIAIELRSLNNLIKRYVDTDINKSKNIIDGITGTNGWIIRFIAENSHRDIYQRDLEETFNITRSTASKVVSLMVQKGLIQYQSVPHDARLKKLVLTEKAIEILEIMKKKGSELESILTRGFSQEELSALYSYIERMKNNMR
ncbi:MarR family winged helix-turn-helix transcriptional regulator [Clostridium polynesiense]|uniref:MarR family winged helix-turn-helix transcriptional regulator n=1 Tax=Clostridium polynesiense TaxID=1325933 RepID=UPI00058C40C1|nr:MarR family winged helix-turn-helix transcriptional regulator [Clostridium polynesiense]